MKLKHCQEIVGTLVEIEEQNDVIKAVFQLKNTIEFPKSSL